MKKEKLYDDLLAAIEADRGDLVDLCLKLGNTSSFHGKERPVGAAVLAWLKESGGIDGALQFITEESVNAVARIPGSGDGTSLIFNAHMDTGPEHGPDASEADKKIEGAWTEGELIFGRGVINDKAQLCAFMIAARAIKRAGIRLRGDLTITGVAFETGGPSVDEYQGINHPGEGFGTKWVVDRGVTADFALVGETSGFGIVRAECGAVWLKVRVKGREVYTPRFERGKSIQENPNAFAKAAHVILALEEWAVNYQEKEKLEFEGGAIIPKAQIMNVRGAKTTEGVSQASPFCDIYMDIRIVPGKKPEAVKKDVERAVRASGIECEVSAFQYSRGHIAEHADELIAAITEAHRYVFGAEPPLPPSAEVSMWRDLNVFNEVGIPSVCYGPPRQRDPYSGAGNRAMKISDLVAATKVYALTALLVCGIE
ncbi:MAG TPA: M20/M25/M40 family metallo-hydrolase [Candidatus Binatia bacterium]|jgi:acetylornithine deacetylase/succinyl-diaminopimelate desuccinylase-like protein